jgi:hypothetical protein
MTAANCATIRQEKATAGSAQSMPLSPVASRPAADAEVTLVLRGPGMGLEIPEMGQSFFFRMPGIKSRNSSQ